MTRHLHERGTSLLCFDLALYRSLSLVSGLSPRRAYNLLWAAFYCPLSLHFVSALVSSTWRPRPLMILPQVHLRKPCYDFYFL